MIKLDGYDEAIIGPACVLLENETVPRLVYDAEKIREILMKRDGMSHEDAREFIEFNIEGACTWGRGHRCWCGLGTCGT